MTTHILHKVTFYDGTSTVTLEPPDWEEMTYDWEPVPVSSMFEGYNGAATKQVNSGATQKWRLTVAVSGCKEPDLDGLSQSVTWTVTLISRDAINAAVAYTLWPVSPPRQSINSKAARRTWTISFREE